MTQQKRAYDLGQRAGESQKRSVQDRETPALMGKVRDDGSISLRGDDAHDDRIYYPDVYIRLYGIATELRTATSVNVGTKPNLPVMVEKNANNQYRVTRLDDVRAAAQEGQQAGDMASPPKTGSQLDLINERNLLLGRLRLAETGTLKVTVDPFLYIDSAGAIKAFDPLVITPLDLASNLPAADGGGNAQHRYVYVTFNPDATTPALVAHEGTEQLATLPFTDYAYTDIDLSTASGHYPLGPVRVQTGDTTLTETRFNASTVVRGQPGRLLLGKLGSEIGGGGLPAFGAQETVQISGGVLDISSATGRNIIVAAESPGTTDTVDSIVGLDDGAAAVFQADAGATITFAHDAGVLNLYNGVNLDLSGSNLLMLVGRGGGEVTQPVDEKGSTGGGGVGDYILIVDQKSSGAGGGTFTSGAWQTRTLNTKVSDAGGHASVSSNQITLAPGTYRLVAEAPAFYVGRHKIRWQDITNGTTIAVGTSAHSPQISTDIPQTTSVIRCEFTIASTTTFEVQHRSQSTQATFGLGVSSGFGVAEIYAMVELIKTA